MRLPADDPLLRLRAAPRREVDAKPVPEKARKASEGSTVTRYKCCRAGRASPKCRAYQRWRRSRSVAARAPVGGYHCRRGPGARNMSMLKDRYLAVCDSLIRETGTENVGYRIPKDATLKQCVSYMNQHIVHDRQHFRYLRYMQMVDHYFRAYLGGPGGGRRPLIVHVDLGTGPGIFNWVVYDYVQQEWGRSNRPQLAQFGYDHCPAMVELAEQIWTDFGVPHEVQYFASSKPLRRAVDAITGDAYLLMTFGHVLIQSYNLIDRSVINSFAKLCNRLARGRNAVDVLAVDAYAYYRSQQFDKAAKRLHKELCGSSVNATARYPWKRVSLPDGVLPRGSRALMSLRGSQ